MFLSQVSDLPERVWAADGRALLACAVACLPRAFAGSTHPGCSVPSLPEQSSFLGLGCGKSFTQKVSQERPYFDKTTEDCMICVERWPRQTSSTGVLLSVSRHGEPCLPQRGPEMQPRSRRALSWVSRVLTGTLPSLPGDGYSFKTRSSRTASLRPCCPVNLTTAR